MKVLSLFGHNVNDIINSINQFKNLQFLGIQIAKTDQSLDRICLGDLKIMVLDCYEFPKFGKNFQNLRALNIMIRKKKIFDFNFFDQCVNLDYLNLFFSKSESLKDLNEKHLYTVREI